MASLTLQRTTVPSTGDAVSDPGSDVWAKVQTGEQRPLAAKLAESGLPSVTTSAWPLEAALNAQTATRLTSAARRVRDTIGTSLHNLPSEPPTITPALRFRNPSWRWFIHRAAGGRVSAGPSRYLLAGSDRA
jgi:hypothetical protein